MYGFLGVLLTHDPFFGAAVQALVWFSLTWTFVHRFDEPPLDIHVHVTQVGVTALGILTGIVVLAAQQSPRLATPDIWSGAERRFSPWLYIFQLVVITLTGGVYFLLDDDDLARGLSLTIIFGIVLVIMIVLYFARVLYPDDGPAQMKYIIIISILAASAAIPDYLLVGTENQSIRPWHTLIYAGALIILYLLMYGFVVYWAPTEAERLWFKNRRARRWFVTSTAIVHFFVYIPALIVDEFAANEFGVPAPTPQDEEQKIFWVLWSVLVTALLVMLVAGALALSGRGITMAYNLHLGAGTARRKRKL